MNELMHAEAISDISEFVRVAEVSARALDSAFIDVVLHTPSSVRAIRLRVYFICRA